MAHSMTTSSIRPSLTKTFAAFFLLGLSACRSAPPPVTLDDLAQKYVALARDLGERDPDSLDFYAGSDPLPKSGAGDSNLHDRAIALKAALTGISEESSRKVMLLQQVDAIAFRAEQLQGKNRSFDDESRLYFGVVATPDADAASRQATRAKIAVLVGGPANSAAAYAKYDAQFAVPADHVPAVMKAALAQCRAMTVSHMTLPASEHVDVEYVSHKPWSAFSRYMGGAHSVIQVNMDYPLTLDRILNLACHEGYPGHHVFNSMRDQTLAGLAHHDEFKVQPTFSPQSYVSEAAASYAPWLIPDSERLHIERDILFPISGIKSTPELGRYIEVQKLIDQLHTAEPTIARDYLDGRLDFARASDAFEREMLMQHGETALLYLNEFRTYMVAYTLGYDDVRAMIEAGDPGESVRWDRYVNLMMNPVVSLPPAGHN
jgi:hypothetical protein